MFLRWSGVAVGDEEGDEGARVGEDSWLEGGGVVGSNARSGIGGNNKGLRVIRSRRKRSMALMNSNKTTLLHLVFEVVFLRRPISTRSSVNLMSSSALAAHLYTWLLSDQAFVKRV